MRIEDRIQSLIKTNAHSSADHVLLPTVPVATIVLPTTYGLAIPVRSLNGSEALLRPIGGQGRSEEDRESVALT